MKKLLLLLIASLTIVSGLAQPAGTRASYEYGVSSPEGLLYRNPASLYVNWLSGTVYVKSTRSSIATGWIQAVTPGVFNTNQFTGTSLVSLKDGALMTNTVHSGSLKLNNSVHIQSYEFESTNLVTLVYLDAGDEMSVGDAQIALINFPGQNSLFAGNVHITGTTFTDGGLQTKAFSTTTNLTLGVTYHKLYVDATAGDVTVTVPARSSASLQEWVITKTDLTGNAVILQRSGADTIQFQTTYTMMAPGESATIHNPGTGTAWFVN